MTKVNPYITFNGNCEEAFQFYKSIFGGDFLYMGRYKDMPSENRQMFPPEADNKIMHVTLPISKETTLMGCDDASADSKQTAIAGNIALTIGTDDKAEADRLFNGLSAGGEIKMPMNQTFWAYFGMLKDRFGVNWMINCEANETK